MEQNLHNEEQLFLEEVTLSGYKSIYDTTITFNKGINIIIGQNAVGKTNFFTFLCKTLNFSYENLYNFKSVLKLKNDRTVTLFAENNIRLGNLNIKEVLSPYNVKTQIWIDKDLLNSDEQSSVNFKGQLRKQNITFSCILICHGIPKDFALVEKPYSLKITDKGFATDFFGLAMDNDLPYFVRSIAANFLFSDLVTNEQDSLLDQIRKDIQESFDQIKIIKPYLKKLSPIEDVRLNNNYNIFDSNELPEKYTLTNLFLEFMIEGNWHPFSNLSDGTKRLFYIIAEVAFDSKFYFTRGGVSMLEPNNINRIILIEEPELGIHPHQLHELMLFIKEQSRHKQIIITTHSPQVLDVLNKDELGNIIIASYEKGEGTKLRHLDDAEIAKAQQYMEEDYLSDYWRFSDLEKEKKHATL